MFSPHCVVIEFNTNSCLVELNNIANVGNSTGKEEWISNLKKINDANVYHSCQSISQVLEPSIISDEKYQWSITPMTVSPIWSITPI